MKTIIMFGGYMGKTKKKKKIVLHWNTTFIFEKRKLGEKNLRIVCFF